MNFRYSIEFKFITKILKNSINLFRLICQYLITNEFGHRFWIPCKSIRSNASNSSMNTFNMQNWFYQLHATGWCWVIILIFNAGNRLNLDKGTISLRIFISPLSLIFSMDAEKIHIHNENERNDTSIDKIEKLIVFFLWNLM